MTAEDDSERRCPACELDSVSVRFIDVPGENTQQDVRWRLPAETIEELYPLMEAFIDDHDNTGGPWLVPTRFGGDLPAGYSEAQERWLTAVVYDWGPQRKAITQKPDADETIKNLRSEGYGAADL